jgi:hypothetical protein
MTEQEFYDACERHDWFYQMSDDGRVFRAGRATSEQLQAEASVDSTGRKLAIFESWSDYHFSGPAYGSEKAPKPVRPE